ncbi:mRNA 3'-end-processing protein rna14 [Rhizina undulata]
MGDSVYDAEAAFLNAMKALQEVDDSQMDSVDGAADGGDGNVGAQTDAAVEVAEGIGADFGGAVGNGPATGDAAAGAYGKDDQEEDNHLKTEELLPASGVSSPPPAASTSPIPTSSAENGTPNVIAAASNEETSSGSSQSNNTSAHVSESTPAAALLSPIVTTTTITPAPTAGTPGSSPVTPVQQSAGAGASTFVDEDNNDYTPPESILPSYNPPVSTSVPSTPTAPLSTANAAGTTPAAAASTAASVSAPTPPTGPKSTIVNKRKRLPQDIVGQLEDRIAEDPRGELDSWLALIDEHRKKGKFDEARATYERFFTVFPSAAEQWIAYARMELGNNELIRVEQIFSRCLLQVPNVELWSIYLDYIRRRNNLTTDTAGKARAIVSQSYEFVLANIGCDKDAGKIWSDYVQFVKSGPGNVGGSGWLDQQKMDSLRKVYQKAVTQPVQGVEHLWKEYDQFEQGLNKMTARKFLQERSALFMTARSCLIELTNITKGLRRNTLPRLPPAPGYEGDDDWNTQVELWKKWIQWEKSDPLVLANDDPTALKTRIIYVYKQALMALRFWPEIWFDAAEYCFANQMNEQGTEFLKQGMAANPESCMLHFRYAEYLEANLPVEHGEEGLVRKGQIIRKPYDDLLNVLYVQVGKIQQREKEELAKLEDGGSYPKSPTSVDDEEEDDDDADVVANKMQKESQIAAIKESSKAQVLTMSKTISSVWINLMRAMRRVQGHGKVNEPLGGSRQIFADARKRGKITSDVYVASALIEYHCYQDPAALKIFERGMKLFPEDEDFALEYLKHLITINDITNARAVFETFVGRAPPDKCKRVYEFFYEYEAHYGELNQVYKLEKRMTELYPNDPFRNRFSKRYSYKAVDPCSYIPVVSPAQQCRPKLITHNIPHQSSDFPIPPTAPSNGRIHSPKRPANDDLSDTSEQSRPRKFQRGDSPLKGAAGRRLDQQKRVQQNRDRVFSDRDGRDRDGRDGRMGGYQYRDGQQQQQGPQGPQGLQRQAQGYQVQNQPPPPTLPDQVMYLLSILPGADKYQAVKFRPEAMVGLLGSVTLPTDRGR